MNQYTIYCTEEQTKKALKLGAPIDFFEENDENNKHAIHVGQGLYAIIPTAEQMRGWLMDKLRATTFINNHYSCVEPGGYGYLIIGANCILEVDASDNGKYLLKSDKEATLAAIDAALEYLTNQKTK